MSGVIWTTWTYCNRLVMHTFYDKNVCVKNHTIEKTTFYLGGNKDYPITKYCTYCGHDRFTTQQIDILSNPNTTYETISTNQELKYITEKNVHPIICSNNDCLLGLYNLSSKNICAYDLDDLLNHTTTNIKSTLDEILGYQFDCDVI